EIDRLEHALRMLLHDVERAIDALARGRIGIGVIDPDGVGEQHEGQDDGPGHHQDQQTDGSTVSRWLQRLLLTATRALCFESDSSNFESNSSLFPSCVISPESR